MPARSIEVISLEPKAGRRTRRRGLAGGSGVDVDNASKSPSNANFRNQPEQVQQHQNTDVPGDAAKPVRRRAVSSAPKTPSAKRKDMSPVVERWSSAPRDSTDDQTHCRNFMQALRKAMIVRGWGVRELSKAIGVEMGTMTKYLKCRVSPYRVGWGIMRNLAAELGVTMEALDLYMQSGDFGNGESIPVNLDQVETWIRTRAGQGDLLALTAAHNELVMKLMNSGAQPAEAEAKPPAPYTWPREALEATGTPQVALDVMGLSEPVLDALEQRGEYDDQVVRLFAGLLKQSEDTIRTAFEARMPV